MGPVKVRYASPGKWKGTGSNETPTTIPIPDTHLPESPVLECPCAIFGPPRSNYWL